MNKFHSEYEQIDGLPEEICKPAEPVLDRVQRIEEAEAKSRADRIRSGHMGQWDRVLLQRGVGKLPSEFAAEIEKAKRWDAGEFHALKTEQLTDKRQLQKGIKLMREKHRRERNDV